ncbi:DUF185-domain-containing protein [Acaromyces ingoldii]|uniref:Protein arginine methyltransferase NDUFAF7 n=1 Tax=Acaromyces ingoldii TaxID=215250 RepID=A0A316YRL9_9BASI|nr:DUF185-domain-containing protein [Acaromyces ingoldii]PWN92027.1 DUF185-domain-containing protein [Acaromyces ingoldii]
MRTCLLDPVQGYYATANTPPGTFDALTETRDVLGARGDFITSPEVSQVFGELLAIFFVARWQNTARDAPLRLVELGPGKGTLLADMLRTFARFAPFYRSIKDIHLVETSPGLMELQYNAIEKALEGTGKRLVSADQEVVGEDEIRVEWFPLVDSVPIRSDSWTMVAAHEFFDALPTHIFERSNDGFKEVLVDVERGGQSGITVLKPGDLTSSSKPAVGGPPKFRYVTSPGPTPWSLLLAMRNKRFNSLQPGQRVEISPEAWAAARRIGELVSGRKAAEVAPEVEEESAKTARLQREAERVQTPSQGGAGLIIDYGDEKAFGGSFRAFRSHKIVDPLEDPGKADLTANVDFWHLKSALFTTDARPLRLMYQAHFLQALGLGPRVEALEKAAANDERRADISSAAKRLVDPTGMGAQYKVLGVSSEASSGGSAEAVAKAKEPADKVYPFEMDEGSGGASAEKQA